MSHHQLRRWSPTTPWPGWEAHARAHADAERRHQNRQHHTIAQLLHTRGLPQAAMVVAISQYSTDQVDNWDGSGQFEPVFAVPPAHSDAVDDQMREALTVAARDVIGAGHLAGIGVQVALADAETGWTPSLIQELRELLVDRKAARPSLAPPRPLGVAIAQAAGEQGH